MRLNSIYLLFISILIYSSCQQKSGKNNQEYKIIDLEQAIKIKKTEKVFINDIADEIHVIPVETNDSTLLEYVFIAGIVDDKIICFDKETLYSIDKRDGKINIIIDNSGPGPTEYKFIIEVVLEGDSIVNIYDTGKRGFLKYDMKGHFINFFTVDSVGNYKQMEDGNFYTSYSPFVNAETHTAVFDKDWNLIRHGVINTRKDVEMDMYYMNNVSIYNRQLFFKDIFGDTIYQVTTQQDNPYIVLYKGKYKVPYEVAATRDRREKEGYSFFLQEDYKIAGNYCFIKYYYDKKLYYDIWDIETSKLFYRGITSTASDGMGVPIKLNDSLIYVWPQYMNENYIYCVVEAEDAIKINPSLPSDTNPLVIEIKLKEQI